MALAVKDAAGFDYQAGGMDFARYHALGLNFHATLGEDHAIKLPGDHHVISLNLALHPGPFSEDQAVGRNHISLHVSVDPKNAGGFERAFKPNTLVEKSGEFVLFRVLTAFL